MPVVDREPELTALRGALQRARTGCGQLVMVEGAAGTGKSTLLKQTAAMVGADDLVLLSARGGELERDYPFGVIRQLFEPMLCQRDQRDRARLLSGAAAPASWMLGLSSEGAGLETAGFAAMRAIYWLTVNLAAERPVVLAVDDAHWADASSLRALDFLARRVTDLDAMLLVAFRPEEPGSGRELLDELRTVPDALRLSPGALARQSVAEIVRARMPAAGDDFCDAVHETTAGNPLLVQELLRALGAGRTAPSPAAVREATVPSLGDRVLRRVGRVAPAGPALARAMAVIGDGGRLALAAALAGIDFAEAGRIACGLRRIEVLSTEDPFSFVHPLVRRSLYDGIPVSERHADHRRLAALLTDDGAPADAAAAHLRELPPSGSTEMAKLFVEAAERALGRAAPDEAGQWLQRALDEKASQPHRSELLARLGLARSLLRDPASIQLLQEAYERATDDGLRSQIAVDLAFTFATAGDWDATADVIARAERDIPRKDLTAMADLTAIRASLELYDSDLAGSFAQTRAVYEAAAQGSQWGARALAALLATEAAAGGRLPEARIHCENALAGGQLMRERAAGGWAAPQLLGALIVLDDLGDSAADAFVVEMDRAARATGSVVGGLTALGASGWLHSRRGDLAAAEADLTTVLTLSREAGMSMAVINAAYFMLDVLLERDGLAEVGELIDQLDLPAVFLKTYAGAMLLETRGRLRIAHNQREAGVVDLRAMGSTLTALGFGPAVSAWRSSLALGLSAGCREEALALAGEELSLARATGLARPQGIALRTLGILARPPLGIEALEESAALLADSPARLEQARSLVALGSALRRANQPTQAREPLRAGLDLAYSCGATRLSEQAQQELLAAGGRRRRSSTSDRDSLTASELRIAELAAGGATNSEIAQTLYVSLKTVETHLSHVYAKLGLAGSGSRARLVDALQGVPNFAPQGVTPDRELPTE